MQGNNIVITAETLLVVRAAETPAEMETASAILVEAAEWLAGRGVPLWDPVHLTPERLAPAYERRELFLAGGADGAAAVGAFLLQEADRLFWPEDPPGEALYLHKLAVRRAFAGTGVAGAMLDWAAEEASRQGRPFLRLDCDAGRPSLCAFYEEAGFRTVDERMVGAFRARRFERPTTPRPR